MKKINKKLILLSTLSIALIAGVSTTLASCGSNTKNDKDKDFDTKPFIDNANKKFIDVNQGMGTIDMVKKILTSTDGINSISNKLGDELFFNWFKNINTSSIKSYFDDQIKESKKVLDDKKKTYKNMNAFQVNVLDPVGVTEEAYIQSNILENLKNKFLEYLFAKDYLAIVDSNNKVIQINNNSPFTKAQINDAKNVNGSTPGTRNNFKFVGNADSNATDMDYGYANFIEFAFNKWVEENVPVLTPSILFKNDANPKESLLFNQDYFGAALTADASYKFQYFQPANQDFQNPNASMLYKTFLTKKDSFVDSNLGGSIDIPNDLTQDSSTKLISLMSGSFDTFVAPYAASVVYKFGKNALNNSDSNVPTSANFSANSIMENFIITKPQNPNKNGEFIFPYIQTGKNPFAGEYAGMQAIKETIDIVDNINDIPWIITRNEFGVHIIGIDRLEAIKKAASGKTNSHELNAAILNELKNTILWRAAQDKSYSAGNKIDLQKTIKDYVSANLSSLFLEYAITSTSTGNNNLFTGSWMNTGFDIKNTVPISYNDLINQANEIKKYNKLFSMKATAKKKIYSLQEEYSGVRDSTQWKNFGIAGALPYTRNTNTGDFDVFDKTMNILFGPKNNAVASITNEKIMQDFESTKTAYLTTLEKFIANVSPAGTDFFNKYPKAGVSQTVITNVPFINRILLEAKSTQVINDVFYDEKYKTYLGDIWDFDGYKFKNAQNQIPSKPNVDTTTTDFTELNKWILSNMQTAYQSEYVMVNFTKTLSTLYYNGDWTDASSLETLAVKLDRESIDKNRFNKAKQDNLLRWEDNYSINSFIKTIAWLLTWDNELKTFTFKNFQDILADSISSSKVGYVAWTNGSNSYADALANRTFGLTGTVDSIKISKQMQEDTKFYEYPYYLTKLNPYSYIGAPDLTSTSKVSTNPANIEKTYFGENDNYYSIAKISDTINATGFLGFQSLNSSVLTNTLPTDLYSGKLLAQNTSNTDVNFKGTLYEYNKENNPTKARQALVDFINNNSSIYELSNLASRMIDIAFGFNDDQIKELESVKVGVAYDGTTLNLPKRKEMLVKLVNDTNAIKDVAFEPLRGEYLWNNKNSFGNISTTIFSDDSKKGSETQYIVSQFNKTDIDNVVLSNSAQKSFLNPNKLLGLTDDAFFKAIIKLALNGEVQNRSNNAWTENFNKTKYVFYDRNLAKLFGEAIVKNWKDFS